MRRLRHPFVAALLLSLCLHALLLFAGLLSRRPQVVVPPLQVELVAGRAAGRAPALSGKHAVPRVHPVAVATNGAPVRAAPPLAAPSATVGQAVPLATTAPAMPATAAVAPPAGGTPSTGPGSPGHGQSPVESARFLGLAQHPPYPEHARALGLEGRVDLRVTVGAGGEVLQVEVLHSSGVDELDRAAVALLSAGPYAPARRAGVAIASRLRISVPYTLSK
jgi:protein TonB